MYQNLWNDEECHVSLSSWRVSHGREQDILLHITFPQMSPNRVEQWVSISLVERMSELGGMSSGFCCTSQNLKCYQILWNIENLGSFALVSCSPASRRVKPVSEQQDLLHIAICQMLLKSSGTLRMSYYQLSLSLSVFPTYRTPSRNCRVGFCCSYLLHICDHSRI